MRTYRPRFRLYFTITCDLKHCSVEFALQNLPSIAKRMLRYVYSILSLSLSPMLYAYRAFVFVLQVYMRFELQLK